MSTPPNYSLPDYCEFWTHSTYLPNCWYQTRRLNAGGTLHRYYSNERIDAYRNLNYVCSAWGVPKWSKAYPWTPNKLDYINNKFGEFRYHVLPYTATNQGLKQFKARGFKITDENDSYLAELMTNNKNVRVVNSSNLDRLNGALTTKSEITLGQLYAGEMQGATGATDYKEYKDVKDLGATVHIDADSHVLREQPVTHSTDPDYPLGLENLNNCAQKAGPFFDPLDFSVWQQYSSSGIQLDRNAWVNSVSTLNPYPYNWDYMRGNTDYNLSWYTSRFAATGWKPCKMSRVLNGKKAFVLGDDMYVTKDLGYRATDKSLTVMMVAKPTGIDTGKIFSNFMYNQRFLVHLPWQVSGSGYFDWARPEKEGKHRLTFEVDMINPAVYTFTANNVLRTATVRVNGVTVAATGNATPHNLIGGFAINGNYSNFYQRWWNPCFLGEMLFITQPLMYDAWLPYERFLMRKWRIPHE